jgi:hypothetical protein
MGGVQGTQSLAINVANEDTGASISKGSSYGKADAGRTGGDKNPEISGRRIHVASLKQAGRPRPAIE